MTSSFAIYKLIILFMLQNAEKELTNSQITEYILEHEYTDYFTLQQSISELEEVEFITRKTISNTSYYDITEDGRLTLSYFEKDLSDVIKREAQEYIKNIGYEIPSRIRTSSDYFSTGNGQFTVRCQVLENDISVMEFSMGKLGYDAAKAISRSWEKKYQDIYDKIMDTFL